MRSGATNIVLIRFVYYCIILGLVGYGLSVSFFVFVVDRQHGCMPNKEVLGPAWTKQVRYMKRCVLPTGAMRRGRDRRRE